VVAALLIVTGDAPGVLAFVIVAGAFASFCPIVNWVVITIVRLLERPAERPQPELQMGSPPDWSSKPMVKKPAATACFTIVDEEDKA
jgi:hypothetical protein